MSYVILLVVFGVVICLLLFAWITAEEAWEAEYEKTEALLASLNICRRENIDLYETLGRELDRFERLSIEWPDTVEAWQTAIRGHVDLGIESIGQCICIPKYNVVTFERAIGMPENKRVK